MTEIFLGGVLIAVTYFIGFIMGVWATHSWVERVAPGTSAQLIGLDERQRRKK